ncbi:MAG TPA: KEOPS complex subunit Pcc1 [Methanobacteriaceae archaeon]|nr:KEOPS complex subunit Pcc1 [Methanobacteriaceae archaeon]
MQIKAQLTFHYLGEEQARIACRSLEPENRNYLESEVQNNDLICRISGESLQTVLATVDDLIFSEILVEKLLRVDGD